MLRKTALVSLALTALAISGCRIVVYDPTGDDATVEGSWTIEGAAPTALSASPTSW